MPVPPYTLAITAGVLAAACSIVRPASATVLFSDNFQGTLSQWNNPASSGEIVAAPGGGNALTLRLLQGGSNLLTTKTGFTSSTGSFTLTFEIYTNCSHTSGCGMFFAINGAGWFLSDTSFGSDKLFADAPGSWETVSYTFAASSLSNVAMEDYQGSPYAQAYPGTDAIYLRDLTLTNNPTGIAVGTLTESTVDAPEPTALAILGVGLLGLIPSRWCRSPRGSGKAIG